MLFSTSYAQAVKGNEIENAKVAAARIGRDLAGFSPALVIYFAASDYDPHILATEMKEAFPGALTLGCSSAGEGVDGKLLHASVVAMAFNAEVFEYCRFALVFEGQPPKVDNAFATVDAAMSYMAKGTGQLPIDLDYHQYVGFLLSDLLTVFTEQLLDRVGELTDVMFVGAIAGDDMKLRGEQTISYDGQVYRDAVLLGLWKPAKGFALIKTQAAELTNHVFVATKVDESKRIIWELDGKPAVQVYAEAIGAEPDKLAQLDLNGWALALTSGGEPFLRPITRIVDGGGLGLISTVREGMRLTLTKSGDVVKTTAKALEEAIRKDGPFSALLHFNCATRHILLDNHQLGDEFAALFEGTPHVSISSYGEIFIGVMAITSTIIAFK